MTQTKAMVWKEWREQRWFLLAGMALINLVPLLLTFILLFTARRVRNGEVFADGVLHRLWHSLSEIGPGFVLSLGGTFAIFLAVGITCRDLHQPLFFFWQSRAISLTRWLVTKYVVGLAILLISCCAVLIPSVFVRGQRWEFDPFVTLVYHTFTLILIYSVSFLLGCLVRRTANAAILSLAASILIYFVPVIFPPLAFLSVYNLILQVHETWYQPGYVPFVLTMLTGSVLAVVFSGIGVHRGWRLPLDQRMIFWSLGGVAIMLFAASAFQLGSNLTCQKQITLPPLVPGNRPIIISMAIEKNHGVLLTAEGKKEIYLIRTADLSRPEPVIGKGIRVGQTPFAKDEITFIQKVFWSAKSPKAAYFLIERKRMNGPQYFNYFLTAPICCGVDLESGAVHQLDLSPYFPHVNINHRYNTWATDQRIYLYNEKDQRLVLIDIKNSSLPKVIGVFENVSFGYCGESGAIKEGPATLDIKPVPGSDRSIQERLIAAVKLRNDPYTFTIEDDILFTIRNARLGEQVVVYRQSDQRKDLIRFRQIGSLLPSPLESLWTYVNGRRNWENTFLQDGFAYVIEVEGLTVYDLRRPEQPRRAGHFAVVGWISALAPLGEGKVLVAGRDKLYILAPPR